MSRAGAFFKGGSATHSSRNVRPCSERSHFPNVTSEDHVRTLFHHKLTSQIYSAEKLNEYQGPKVEAIITENYLDKLIFFSPPSKHRAQASRSSRGRQCPSSRNLSKAKLPSFLSAYLQIRGTNYISTHRPSTKTKPRIGFFLSFNTANSRSKEHLSVSGRAPHGIEC